MSPKFIFGGGGELDPVSVLFLVLCPRRTSVSLQSFLVIMIMIIIIYLHKMSIKVNSN